MKIPQMNRIQYGAEPSKNGDLTGFYNYNYDIGIYDIYIYIYIEGTVVLMNKICMFTSN